MNREPILSVVVCTYNRSKQLKRTLESLVQQTLSSNQYEIVVVNNGSTDNTIELVHGFSKCKRGHNFLLVMEMRPGLGYARNMGWKQSRGKYVGFIDDDATADPNWLQLVLECFEKVKPPPLEIGGPVYPFYEGVKPDWFKDKYEIRTWGNQPRFLEKMESFSGSNMFFKREVIQECGGFDERVGMKGNLISVGEETSLVEKMWKKYGNNTVIYYSPLLIVYHEVPRNKMTVSYQMKRAFATGQGWYLRKGPIHFRIRLTFLLNHLQELFSNSLNGLFQFNKYPKNENWLWECFSPVAVSLGRLLGCMKIFIPLKQRSQ